MYNWLIEGDWSFHVFCRSGKSSRLALETRWGWWTCWRRGWRGAWTSWRRRSETRWGSWSCAPHVRVYEGFILQFLFRCVPTPNARKEFSQLEEFQLPNKPFFPETWEVVFIKETFRLKEWPETMWLYHLFSLTDCYHCWNSNDESLCLLVPSGNLEK